MLHRIQEYVSSVGFLFLKALGLCGAIEVDDDHVGTQAETMMGPVLGLMCPKAYVCSPLLFL